jgi:hydroxybutyrate-dimer hydrolase
VRIAVGARRQLVRHRAGAAGAGARRNRCAALKAKGLLAKPTLAEQADEALDKLLAAGWQVETIPLHATHYTQATPSIATTYSNTYGKFSVKDNLCGLSFAGVDGGQPAALTAAQQRRCSVPATASRRPRACR